MSKREIALHKLSEIADGEMKEISVGEASVLLTRVDGKLNAIGARCTHYGAPLAEGALVGDRIICPWHHACFDARSGDLIEPPALDSLPNYPLRVDGDDIYVEFTEGESDRRTPKMAKPDLTADERTFVILGGGAAGYMAAQTLREDGFAGRIVMVTRENRPPYDRPNLSKDYLQGHAEPAWMPLRSEEFYIEHGIDVMLEKEAINVDTEEREITFNDGEKLIYDSLLIATGGTPRKLAFQTDSHRNVFLLRSFADTDAIMAGAGEGSRAVVIGAGFIGMETASSLRRGCDVTVVTPDKVPFEKVLGTEIGNLFRTVHERNGVSFKLGRQAISFEGSETVTSVILDDGERIPADLVIVGVGIKPATDLIKGVDLQRDGGVNTDDHMCISAGVYAAGDITYFPDPRTREMTRIEHWRTALQQGRTAAHNMAGKPTAFTAVPFFWTTQFDVTLNYVGHVRDWSEVIVRGKVAEEDFLAFYVKDHRVLAVAGMNRDRELAVLEELIRLNRIPSPQKLRDESFDLLNPPAEFSTYAAPRALL